MPLAELARLVFVTRTTYLDELTLEVEQEGLLQLFEVPVQSVEELEFECGCACSPRSPRRLVLELLVEVVELLGVLAEVEDELEEDELEEEEPVE